MKVSYNKFIAMGNLVKDPNMRQTNAGKSVCSIDLAINEDYKDSEGNKQEETCFVEVVAFGKLGENLEKWFKKGDPIHIEGKLHFNTWVNSDGVQRSKHNITLQSYKFVGGGKK